MEVAERIDLKSSRYQKNLQLCMVTDLTRLLVAVISQYTHMCNHCVVHLKANLMMCVNYISIF